MSMLFKSLLRNIRREPVSAAVAPRPLEESMAEARALFNAGDFGRVQILCEDALDIDPRQADALELLGLMGHRNRDLGSAIEYFSRSVKAWPNNAIFHNNLGSMLVQSGRTEEAAGLFRRALEIDPGLHEARTNLLFIMVLLDGVRPEEIYAEHVAWAKIHADPLPALSRGHANARDPERRLRVGYVSADFRQHALSYFIEPALELHDAAAFELVCFHSGRVVDAVTRRLMGHVEHWHEIADLDDAEAAGLIRGEGIDILVDLSGHLRGNRLLAFARRPAPVQVTYLAYPSTTGMAAMDYRFTDAICDPPGATDRYYRETLLRLPRCMLCYQPHADMPAVAALPARNKGRVTFASMNGANKVTARMLSVWARILEAVPDSSIVFTTVPEQGRDRIRNALQGAGVEASRITLHDYLDKRDFWALYEGIDILLDTFPCNGGTTSCEAIWLGAPVVTLCGEVFQSRLGLRILGSLGLGDLIARNDEEYVRIAVELARDTGRLEALRTGLRERMRASCLTDAPAYARDLESAYRSVWRAWCAGAPA